MERERQHQLRNHANVVRAQIAKNSSVAQQERLDYLEEGKKVRQKLEDDRLKVEAIKQKKLGQIQELGIEQKYQYELAKKKILWAVFNWRITAVEAFMNARGFVFIQTSTNCLKSFPLCWPLTRSQFLTGCLSALDLKVVAPRAHLLRRASL